MPNRFAQLNQTHYRAIIITCLAASVALFDFLAFWYVAENIAHVFLPNISTANNQFWLILLFVSAYISLPVGGYLLGLYGDKRGRKPTLFISLLGVSLLSLIIAILPTYETIGISALILFLLARILQGAFFAGQHSAAWVYIIETLPVKNIGIGCGIIVAGAMFSTNFLYFLTSFIEDMLTYQQMQNFGWRLIFAIGGILGLIVVAMHRFLKETPVFIDNKTQILTPAPTLSASSDANHNANTALTAQMDKHWQNALMIFVLSWIMSSIIVVTTLLFADLAALNFFVPDHFLDIGMQLSVFFMMIGAVFFGFMTDIMNVGKVLVIGGLLFIVAMTLLTLDLQTGGQIALLYFVLVGFFGGVIGAIPPVMARLIAVKSRLSTLATCYNLAYSIIGVVIPPALGYFTFYSEFAPLVYVIFVVILLIFCSFYLYYHPRTQEAIHRFE